MLKIHRKWSRIALGRQWYASFWVQAVQKEFSGSSWLWKTPVHLFAVVTPCCGHLWNLLRQSGHYDGREKKRKKNRRMEGGRGGVKKKMAKKEKLRIAEELVVLIFFKLVLLVFLHRQKGSLGCGFAFLLSSYEILFSQRSQDQDFLWPLELNTLFNKI